VAPEDHRISRKHGSGYRLRIWASRDRDRRFSDVTGAVGSLVSAPSAGVAKRSARVYVDRLEED